MLKKYVIIFILLSLTFSAVFAEKYDYAIKNFSEIRYSIAGDLYVTQGRQFKVTLEATPQQKKKIVIKRSGSVLEIRRVRSLFGINLTSFKGIVIRVELPVLQRVSTSSSGSVYGQSSFTKAKLFKMNTSSTGSISLEVKAEQIEGSCSSSGSINLMGETDELFLKTSSSGDINFKGKVRELLKTTISSTGKIYIELPRNHTVSEGNFKISSSGDLTVIGKGDQITANSSSSGDLLLDQFTCQSMQIKLSSSGNGRVHVSDKLNVQISGSGSVYYSGTAKIEVSASGSGKVVPLQE
ncbi:MAG: DUF2807 domain-containing protein [Spirochaetes bacterium]|nr:DUF2807 domain-containing protein [Spirochaetota bacterium]